MYSKREIVFITILLVAGIFAASWMVNELADAIAQLLGRIGQ